MIETLVKHTCGHEVKHRHAGDDRTRRERIAWLQAQPCQTCWQQQQAEASKALGADLDLPELDGEDGDCQWADRIRAKIMHHNHSFYERLARSASRAPEEDVAAHAAANAAKDAYDRLRGQAEAKWWIDNRFEAMNYVRDETAATIQPLLDKQKD